MIPSAYFDRDAERSVIGAIMQDATCAWALDSLAVEDFYVPEYRDVFGAAQKLAKSGAAVDALTVTSRMRDNGTEDVSGILLDAIRRVPSIANLKSYVGIVLENSRRRQVKALCEQAIEALATDGADAALDMAMDGLRGMIGGESLRITAGQVAAKTFDMLEAISKGELKAIPTPLPDLNYTLSGGLRNGELTVLAAYTGQGKSAMAQEVARHAARNGNRVLLVSREMGAEQYGLRAFSSITGLNVGAMLDARKMQGEQWAALADAIAEMDKLQIEFTFRASTIEDVRREARRMKHLDLLVVDYLQILRTREKFPNDNSRVAHISRMLKDIALDLQIPVLALSQFSRPLKGVKARPRLSDLRDSGSIEQDADNVWLMWQPETDADPDVPPHHVGWVEAAQAYGHRYLLLDVAKQRMGRLGTVGICFNPKRMTFYTPAIEGREGR